MAQAMTTERALNAGLVNGNSENTKRVLHNIDMYNFTLAMFNSTLKMASGKPSDIIAAMSTKAFATTDAIARQTRSEGIAVTSASLQIITHSASMLSLAGKTHPGAALATVGAMLATKTSIALGLVGKDDKKAACIAAMADMAAAGMTLTAGVITSGSGVGLILVATSLSQIALSSYAAHQACLSK